MAAAFFLSPLSSYSIQLSKYLIRDRKFDSGENKFSEFFICKKFYEMANIW